SGGKKRDLIENLTTRGGNHNPLNNDRRMFEWMLDKMGLMPSVAAPDDPGRADRRVAEAIEREANENKNRIGRAVGGWISRGMAIAGGHARRGMLSAESARGRVDGLHDKAQEQRVNKALGQLTFGLLGETPGGDRGAAWK